MTEKKKLVFIGNSIVNGFPLKRSQCFAGLIRQETGWDVINKGVNGQTTTDLDNRFDRDVLSHKPNMFFILSGTNDFIYGEATPEQAFANLEGMAKRALSGIGADGIKYAEPNTITPVFLTPIPTDPEMASRLWMAGAGVDYQRVNRQMFELTTRIKAAAFDFIDLNGSYQQCGQYHDGVHPTEEGHRFIAGQILNWLGSCT
ncbi:MAG: GDSL-type esterase/lipase family protein [Bacillota bacterium]|nr:GDSL-type esterase/lipase family protein [Bacillota bacterium]